MTKAYKFLSSKRRRNSYRRRKAIEAEQARQMAVFREFQAQEGGACFYLEVEREEDVAGAVVSFLEKLQSGEIPL